MDIFSQPIVDRIVRYVGFEQRLMKHVKRDWRFEEARAYLNRLHHLYMCIRTQRPPKRTKLMTQLRRLMQIFDYKYMTPHMRHYILMGEVLRKTNCTDRRRQRYVELYALYTHLKKFIKHPKLLYYPYIEYSLGAIS